MCPIGRLAEPLPLPGNMERRERRVLPLSCRWSAAHNRIAAASNGPVDPTELKQVTRGRSVHTGPRGGCAS